MGLECKITAAKKPVTVSSLPGSFRMSAEGLERAFVQMAVVE